MGDRELDRVQAAFTRQAGHWRAGAAAFIGADLADWIVGRIPATADDVALDVAGGSGQLALALAPRLSSVTVVDATEAMLEQGRNAAADAGIANVTFRRGNAYALPFADGAFDLVACRFSVHHFEKPAVAIAEMCRVARPGGHVVIADLVAPEDASLAAAFNGLEQARDPSHAAFLSATALNEAIRAAGLHVASSDERWLKSEVDDWLSFAAADEAAAMAARDALMADLRGGPATGMFPSVDDGVVSINRQVVVLVARKAG